MAPRKMKQFLTSNDTNDTNDTNKKDKTDIFRIWLLITTLNGNLKGKLIPVLDGMHDDDGYQVSTEFAGIFYTDILDRRVPDLPMAEDSIIIIAKPKSEKIQSPWHPTEYFHLCDGFMDEDFQTPSQLCSRTLLQSAMKELNSLGFECKCGVELEWTMSTDEPKPLRETTPHLGFLSSYSMNFFDDPGFQDFLSDMVEKTKTIPVGLEAIHAEVGNSMCEASLHPSDPITMSDSVQLYRMFIRRIAREHGMVASFSPKPYKNSVACGMHVHISIHPSEENKDVDESAAKTLLFNQFLAGMLHHMPSSLLLLMSNVQSYKRMGGNSFTPEYVSYGIEGVDARKEAIRCVHMESTKGTSRLELRVAGADANPYLVLYYCLKAGMWALHNKITLDDVGPPKKHLKPLPTNVKQACEAFMDKKSFARELYGDAFVDHFGTQRLYEAENIPLNDTEQMEFLAKAF